MNFEELLTCSFQTPRPAAGASLYSGRDAFGIIVRLPGLERGTLACEDTLLKFLHTGSEVVVIFSERADVLIKHNVDVAA